MPRIPVKGTDLTAQVDADMLKKLPKSIWADRMRSRVKPICRYEGRTMTLLRAVGLMSGLSPKVYILPKNGDHFDCRRKNAGEFDDIPTADLPVYKNSKSGVKGIRSSADGRYTVVLRVGGKEKSFGSTRDLEIARVILQKARKMV